MPRIDRRKLEKLEEMLRGEKHVELVIVNNDSNETIFTQRTGPRINYRLVVRI
jgi:hypothetical protein